MSSLSAKLNVSLVAILSATPDGGQGVDNIEAALATAFTNGTGNGKAQKLFVDERTLASNTNETLDLSGTLTNSRGEAVAFTKVKGLLIIPNSANTTTLTIGGASAEWQGPFAAAGDKILIPAGKGAFLFYAEAGWAVTDTSADGLKIVNSTGAAATYTVAVIGE